MRFSIQGRIVALVLLFLLSVVVLGVVNLWVTRQVVIEEKKQTLRHLVEVATRLVDHYQHMAQDGRLSNDEARSRAMAAVRALRYDGVEYFWIQSASEPRMLMHPIQPEIEGRIMADARFERVSHIETEAGVIRYLPVHMNIGQATLELVRDGQGGFVTYTWARPVASDDGKKTHPKLSYVRAYAPWQWVVGTGVYIDDVDALIWQIALRNLVVIAVIGLLFLGMALYLARSVLHPLRRSADLIAQQMSTASSDGRMELPVDREDEIGTLLQMFNQLRGRLREREEKLMLAANVFDHAREAIMVASPEGRILEVNEAFTRITGYSREEVFGQTPRVLSSGRHDAAFYAAMWRAIREDGEWQGEIWNKRKNGEIYPEQLTISTVFGPDRQPRQYVAIFSDITERKTLEAQIEHLAYYDALTDLPNRRLLEDRLRQVMAVSRRHRLYAALLVLDLDNFKPLNDLHGHAAGDLLLIEVARRLLACVRASDTVARLGGDEFVVVLSELATEFALARSQAEVIAGKILAAIGEPYRLQSASGQDGVIEHRCSTSIGVHLFIDHEQTQEEIVRDADMAMYRAKEEGRGAVRFSDSANSAIVDPD